MKTASLRFDIARQKWVCTYSGITLGTGTGENGKQQIIRRIENGENVKAFKMGVTAVEVGEGYASMAKGTRSDTSRTVTQTYAPKTITPSFTINERFKYLEEFTTMVAERKLPSLIVTGESGLGKTYTVFDTLRSIGLESNMIEGDQSGYLPISGFTTPLGLYETMHDNYDKIIVFDDCDSVLENQTTINLLKAALDSYETRTVSWVSGRPAVGYASSFNFTGGIVFISNKPQYSIPPPIRTRAITVDLSMSNSEKIERMETVLESVLPELSLEIKRDALSFLKQKQEVITTLNFRSLLITAKIRASGNPEWRNLSLYALTA